MQHRRARTEIDLGFFAPAALQSAKRKFALGVEPTDEPVWMTCARSHRAFTWLSNPAMGKERSQVVGSGEVQSRQHIFQVGVGIEAVASADLRRLIGGIQWLAVVPTSSEVC